MINNANPQANVTPADMLAALRSLVEDRFEFDITIKYRSPMSKSTRQSPLPLQANQLKQGR